MASNPKDMRGGSTKQHAKAAAWAAQAAGALAASNYGRAILPWRPLAP